MFRKPFKIKSNSQIKGSERKIIKEQLLKSFKTLNESDIENLIPKKETLSSLKILTSNNETIQVYTIQKRAIIFIIREILYPTVYLLWKYPNLIPTFTTHSDVFSFIISGADLMLPGVVTSPTQIGMQKYGSLQENEIAYVNFINNQAAMAVGVTVKSSYEMVRSQGKGKCLTIYHYYGDKLCMLEGMLCLPIIELGPPEWSQSKNYDEEFPCLNAQGSSSKTENLITETKIEENYESNVETKIDQETEITSNIVDEIKPDDMDELLNYCFFVAIKYSKTLILPILTSNFYKLQMIPVCPKDKTLDIKKSSYKKLKSFLDHMCKLNIITVKEIKKGVESLTMINKDHPKFSEFYVDPSSRPKEENQSSDSQSKSIIESYIITQNVLPIFSQSGLQKGDTIQVSEIRKFVTKYVKQYDCHEKSDRKLVKLNDVLSKLCKTENAIAWGELFEKVCNCMKPCYKVSSGCDEVLNKGKISPITMIVSVRSGNKKVTLVDNLELFGISILQFAKECQHGVAASTSISKPTGKKVDQLLIQGNQVLFVYNLLTEKYKIPKKYIKGLENAPKKKK